MNKIFITSVCGHLGSNFFKKNLTNSVPIRHPDPVICKIDKDFKEWNN